MTVTISNKLPKTDENGLAHLEGWLAEHTDETLIVVGVMRTDRITSVLHDSNKPRIVTTALLHVEVVDGKEAAAAEKALRRVHEQRTGKRALPFEGDGDTED